MTRELVWLLRHRGGRGPDGSLELGPGALLTIGRGSESQLILDDPEISRLHAKLEMRTEGVWIQDLGSNNGTYIDEQRVTSRLWQPGQVLRLGSVKFELDGKPAEKRLAVQADRTHPGRAYLLTWESKKTQTKRSKSTDPASRTTILTIGRNAKCDIVLDDRAVSKSHARVELRGDGIEVRDLDSANGTFIEGTRITASQWRPGETLKIGSFAEQPQSAGDRFACCLLATTEEENEQSEHRLVVEPLAAGGLGGDQARHHVVAREVTPGRDER